MLTIFGLIGLGHSNQQRHLRPNILFILVDDLRWDDGMDELYDLKADPEAMKRELEQLLRASQ